MKAAVLREINKPLEIEDIAHGDPGPREVLIRTAAVGVNRPDVMQRTGALPAPPLLVVGPQQRHGQGATATLVQGLAQRRRDRPAMIMREQGPDPRSDQILRADPGQADERGVDLLERQRGPVEQGDPVDRGLEERAKARLGRAEGVLGQVLLGDVGERDEDGRLAVQLEGAGVGAHPHVSIGHIELEQDPNLTALHSRVTG